MSDQKLEDDQSGFPDWKAIACAFASPVFANLLHTWLSAPFSWGIAVFVAFVLYYEAPPRLRGRHRSILGTLLSSASAGLVIAIGAFVSGKST